MSEQRGRCNNVEYCSAAVAQKVVTVPDGAPFICPKCSENLEPIQEVQRAKRNRVMLVLQAVVIVAGAGAVAYKLLGTSASDQPGANTGPATPSASQPAANPALAAVVPSETLAPPVSQPATPSPVAPAVAPTSVTPAAVGQADASATTPLLRLAGSNIMSAKLARRLASGYLALIGDSDITTQAETKPNSVAIVGNQAGEHEKITILQGGSGSGFNALLRGDADAAMSVRAPTQAEIEKLASVADLTSPANEHVVAVDAIVPIVSPINRTPVVTVAQLRDVLTGKITDWAALGRNSNGPIHVVVQDDAAGTLDTAAGFVLGDAALAAGARRVGSEADVATAVAGDTDAIGLVSFGHAGTARTMPVASGSAAPIEASELSVSTEDYALTRRLYLYTAQVSGSTAVRRFAEYATSATGQAVVEAAGFVPLTLRQTAVLVPEGASARFRALVAGASRVSLDFRFQPGSTELDSRSVHDIDQLVSFLRREHVDGSRLILAGFADSLGAPQANQIVSQRRVDAVVAALGRLGVTPGRTAVFGAELPVADNATPEGRERNRRVEVYLLP